MLDAIINKTMKHITTFFKEYELNFNVQYNSDLDMLSQYSKSLDTRALFGNTDLKLINEDDIKALKKDGHILLMYNYSPLQRVEDKFNNINFEAVFNPQDQSGLKEINRYVNQEGMNQDEAEEQIAFLSSVRKLNEDETLEHTVRDMIYGKIDFTCKFLSSSSKNINELQFLHIQKLQRNHEIEMSFDFGGDIGRVEFPYQTKFQAIESIGHIDYVTYGNLQELTFTFTIEGPFFSSYSTKMPILEQIDLTIGFTK